MWLWQAVVVVPTCVAVEGGGSGAHMCGSGSGRRWWWCPRVWQWQAVVVVPTCVVVEGGVMVVPTCVVEKGGVVVVATCLAVECGGGGAHVCDSGRRWW